MANLGRWQEEMFNVRPATQQQVRDLSVAINQRLGAEGWYALYKQMDSSGDGKISWLEFATVVNRERLVVAADDDMQLRKAWKALDPMCTGFLSLNEFAQFMKLGTQRAMPPPTLQQLAARRTRVTADHELTASTASARQMKKERVSKLTEEADRLQRELKNDGDKPRRRARAQTDRSHYREILSKEVDESKYLANADTFNHRRQLGTYRRINERNTTGSTYLRP